MMRYGDRRAAGRALARALAAYAAVPDVLVLGLPRGGVPVAFEVARALGAELDAVVVRKLGVPWQPELAMGAIGPGGARVLNDDVVAECGVTPAQIDAVAAAERRELERREAAYRGGRPPPRIAGRTVIVVDDGLATGATMRAALRALRAQGPARLVAAVPVAPADAPERFTDAADAADAFVCPLLPAAFDAVGRFYDEFDATSDAEVRALLAPGHGAGE